MKDTGKTQHRCVAVLPPGDPRGKFWMEIFSTIRVPVKSSEAAFTTLPDGTQRMCYFVDFTSCDWLKPRIIEATLRRPQGPRSQAVLKMLEQDIYPVIADNVTVVRAPVGLWQLQ